MFVINEPRIANHILQAAKHDVEGAPAMALKVTLTS